MRITEKENRTTRNTPVVESSTLQILEWVNVSFYKSRDCSFILSSKICNAEQFTNVIDKSQIQCISTYRMTSNISPLTLDVKLSAESSCWIQLSTN